MCQKKPHPRCSSHASKALEKATLTLDIDLHDMRHIRMSVEGRQRLLVSQDSKCKICSKNLNNSRFNIDHSHSDNHVRGILRPSSNVGIGNLQENSELFDSAREYLMEFSESAV